MTKEPTLTSFKVSTPGVIEAVSMVLLKFTTMVVMTGIPAEPPLGVREVIVNVAGVPPLRSSPPPSAVQLADPPSRRAKRRNGGERICTYAKGDPASGEEFRETVVGAPP